MTAHVKLLKLKDVLERIPVSRTHIYNLIAAGKFPHQVKLGGFGAFWVEAEVEAWIQGHIDATNRDLNPPACTNSNTTAITSKLNWPPQP